MSNNYTEAQKRATAKYHAEKMDSICLRVPKGTKDRWKALAEAQGKSLARFIADSIE